jgi:hypothetical protein
MLRKNLVAHLLRVTTPWPVMLALLLVLSARTATAQDGITVSVEPLGTSAVEGVATLESQRDLVQVALDMEGLQPGVEYQARLYAGTPAAASASFGVLGSLIADETGRARLLASQMQASGAAQTIDLTYELLADGDHFIAIFEPSVGSVAAGTLPPAGPAVPEAEGTRSSELDDVLAAVERRNVQRLLSLVRMMEVPCGPSTPEGFEIMPACGTGESDGTPGLVLPAASCERYWAHDPEPVMQSFVDHVGTLHAVVRASQGAATGSVAPWPEYDYLAIYAPRPDSYMRGLGLFVQDGSIVAIEAGCNTPDQLMHWGSQR